MKREELKAKGIADADIDYILDAWHNEQKSLLGQVQTLTKERDDAIAETKKYQKDGELYIDRDEHDRLKNFEKDTLTKETTAKKTAALDNLYKSANVSESARKLLIKATDLQTIDVDEKGVVKGGVELLKQARADFPDLGWVDGNTGVPHSPTKESGNTGFNFNFTGVRERPEVNKK